MSNYNDFIPLTQIAGKILIAQITRAVMKQSITHCNLNVERHNIRPDFQTERIILRHHGFALTQRDPTQRCLSSNETTKGLLMYALSRPRHLLMTELTKDFIHNKKVYTNHKILKFYCVLRGNVYNHKLQK